MTVFAYKATDPRQSPLEGTIVADTPRQARDALRGRGLTVREIAEHAEAGSRWTPRSSGRYAARLTTAVRETATLLGVGIHLVEALDMATQQQRGRFRVSLLKLRDRVAAGMGLAEAMAEQPDVFDPLCIHMVEVGERSGTLEGVLQQWADFRERSLLLTDRVMTALMYPAFVLAMGLGVTVFLMTFVIPSLLENLIDAGRELPWATRVVKGISDLLVNHGLLVAAGLALLAIALSVGLRTPQGKRLWHRSVLAIPLVGTLATKQAISRIAMIMATLIKSGVEFLRALEIAARSTDNLILRDALEAAGEQVGAGQDIGKALENARLFPPMVVKIFAVGQESGRLEEMLERLAADYDRQVASASARLTAALEPALILVLAMFVGFILFATILPILEAGNVL